MIGHPEIERIIDLIPALPNVYETCEAWQIDIAAFAKMADQFTTDYANRVVPLGPMTTWQALHAMMMTGVQFGYLMRNELELQKEAVA